MKKERLPRPLVKQTPESAANLFMRTVMNYPASETCQAASIAAECAANEVYPTTLAEVLLNDKPQQRRIHEAALRIHERRNVSLAASDLPFEDVPRFIEMDFPYAEELLVVPPDQLQTFLSEYTLPSLGKWNEGEMKERMERMVQSAQKRQRLTNAVRRIGGSLF